MSDTNNNESVYTAVEMPEGTLDDLAKLTNLTAETLLHEVQVRYDKDQIYVRRKQQQHEYASPVDQEWYWKHRKARHCINCE